ncbi:hypothetical protein [Luteimonas sp. 100069]|uniref:hypothetical protein n=1 Tax=Luteimonas sp. 100069 TaxID=2006109 RepID=UPI000F50E6CA|nr:hypothetical protein [Luteimonas sp. 100069]
MLAATADSGSTAAQATAGDITITADGALPGFDHKALEKVADIERHEIRAARHALDRKNMKPEVRSYAETLLADSTRNLAETERLLGTSSKDGGKDHASTSPASTSTTASTTSGRRPPRLPAALPAVLTARPTMTSIGAPVTAGSGLPQTRRDDRRSVCRGLGWITSSTARRKH